MVRSLFKLKCLAVMSDCTHTLASSVNADLNMTVNSKKLFFVSAAKDDQGLTMDRARWRNWRTG